MYPVMVAKYLLVCSECDNRSDAFKHYVVQSLHNKMDMHRRLLKLRGVVIG